MKTVDLKKPTSQTIGLGTSLEAIKAKAAAKKTITNFINDNFVKSNRKPTSADVITFVFSTGNRESLKKMLKETIKPLRKNLIKVNNAKIDTQIEKLKGLKEPEDD